MAKLKSNAVAPITFRATVDLNGKTATGIRVPASVVEQLGSGKHPAVRVTLNHYTYPSHIAVMGGEFLIPVSAEVRARSDVAAGDTVQVQLELDTAPREVAVPADFDAALHRDKTARKRFDALSYSHKRRHVLAIQAAKTPETRQRRIARAIEMLREDK